MSRSGVAWAKSVRGLKRPDDCNARCRKLGLRGIARRRLRAKRLGATELEPIRAIDVFEEAGWRCERCGKSAPREIMGKNTWDSPELDHIVALHHGGPHTRANVQCLCRRGNVDKSKGERAAPQGN